MTAITQTAPSPTRVSLSHAIKDTLVKLLDPKPQAYRDDPNITE